MRYIDADVLIKAIADIEYKTLSEMADARCNPERYTDNFIMGSACQLQGLAHAAQAILETPTADVVEVVRGEWIVEGDGKQETWGVCNICNMKQCAGELNYCPNCGADMRGKKYE